MNSLCAANAAIGKSIIPAYDSQFVVLTAPFLISDTMLLFWFVGGVFALSKSTNH